MKCQYLLLYMLLLLNVGCTNPEKTSTDEIISEAQAFFDNYASDLLAKNAEAVASRYDRSGAYILGNGNKTFQQYDSIKSRYLESWVGPDVFEWQDLSFEAIGQDAVLVLGKFLWTASRSNDPLTFSYSGLLVRQDGELRIRVEDESVNPMDMKDYICPPDSASME